jgi:hypothetical protein
MRGFAILALSAVMAAAPWSAGRSATITGEATLWSNPQTRYILVGEVHGTAEAPALFGDLACDSHASGRPVVAAVELNEGSQAAIDAFIASDGGLAARRRFLQHPIWNMASKDGRSSQAYLALFEQLRICFQARKIAGVAAIQPSWKAGWTDNDLNAAMAALLERAAERRKAVLVVALMGNFHVRREPQSFGGRTITPAAARLPAGQTVRLSVVTGGQAWNCAGPRPADCGVHALSGLPPGHRSVSLDPSAASGFDGTIDLGVSATASPPAIARAPYAPADAADQRSLKQQ